MEVLTSPRTADETLELVLQAQAGDRQAVGHLCEEFSGMIQSVAKRIVRDPDQAQDVHQLVCLTIMRKIGQLQDPAAFAGWVRTIARGIALNQVLRHKPAYSGTEELMAFVPDTVCSSLEEALRTERAELVHKALAAVSELDRRMLTAYYLEGRTNEDIAQQEGADVPLTTIRRRLHMARLRFASAYNELLKDDPEPVRGMVQRVDNGDRRVYGKQVISDNPL